MLILTRRTGESVKIGDEVTVTLLGVKGGQVRLGFRHFTYAGSSVAMCCTTQFLINGGPSRLT